MQRRNQYEFDWADLLFYRAIPPEDRARLLGWLERTVRELTAKGVRIFSAGGALGFDTMAAETVLRLQREFPDIRLILVLPCRDQTRGWRPENVARYEYIRGQADKVIYTSERYLPD